MEKWELPHGWQWKTLSEISQINPPRPKIMRADDASTSFVPMSGVDETEGRFAEVQIRPYEQVKRGYTYFEENDVLFAKITPSMENGKAAIARGLIDGIGFGTTEFHVFKPHVNILPEWIHRYIRRVEFRKEAKEHFRGAVGQKRVPDDFLVDYPIPVPYPNNPDSSLDIQRRIVARLDALMEELKETRKLQQDIVDDANKLMGAFLGQVFDPTVMRQWSNTFSLGEVVVLRPKPRTLKWADKVNNPADVGMVRLPLCLEGNWSQIA